MKGTNSVAERSVFLDNAKGILILLVVFGHLIEQAALQNGLSRAFYGAIYLFHIPAFAMLSGITTRPNWNHQKLAQDSRKLLFAVAGLSDPVWRFPLSLCAP